MSATVLVCFVALTGMSSGKTLYINPINISSISESCLLNKCQGEIITNSGDAVGVKETPYQIVRKIKETCG